jgi:hypothetical protein
MVIMASLEAKVDGPMVAVSPDFAVAGEVITRSHNRALSWDAGDEQVRCYACGQGILWLRHSTMFTMNDLETVLIAHLIQRHGWTRESAA